MFIIIITIFDFKLFNLKFICVTLYYATRSVDYLCPTMFSLLQCLQSETNSFILFVLACSPNCNACTVAGQCSVGQCWVGYALSTNNICQG